MHTQVVEYESCSKSITIIHHPKKNQSDVKTAKGGVWNWFQFSMCHLAIIYHHHPFKVMILDYSKQNLLPDQRIVGRITSPPNVYPPKNLYPPKFTPPWPYLESCRDLYPGDTIGGRLFWGGGGAFQRTLEPLSTTILPKIPPPFPETGQGGCGPLSADLQTCTGILPGLRLKGVL